MGQRGPKPKHPSLKILGAGSVTSGRKQSAGRVRKGIPPRPPELTGEAAAEWDHVAVELESAGLLSVVDRGILAAYCLAVADMLAARDAINREGRWLKVPIQSSKGAKLGTRTVEHPAVKLIDRASARVQKLAHELGLSASSRARLECDTATAEAGEGNKAVAIRERIKQARSGG